ncbi:hypothetical protein SAMN05216364_100598 [Porphyromonadaceae bacterium KHP3R9]|nr:hypothetical protein SAMN05216364_100598 [Porphyromonadaceae bacterium KHP3R9]
MSEKEKLQGINLQLSAIFVRLDALKDSLTGSEKDAYNRIIEAKFKEFKEKYDADPEQLEKWFR